MKLAQTLSPDNSEQILFLHKEQDSEVIVYSNKEIIWLTVDGVVQTAIEQTAPYRPVLPHCFVMLLPLLHDEEPTRVLELGAGALGLQRYLLFSHPNIEMTSIENSASIIEANAKCFPESQSLNIINEDAYGFVEQQLIRNVSYDWVMIDLFYGENSPFLQETQAFVESIYGLLNNDGWLIINMLTKDEQELSRVSNILKQAPDIKVYLFRVPDLQNHIFMCRKIGQGTFHFPEEIETHNLAK